MSTLVLDATGTPEPVYLRSGIAQIEMAAGTAPQGQTPTPAIIPLITDHMVVAVVADENKANAVELPTDAPIGALVEAFTLSNIVGVTVSAPTGETVIGNTGLTGAVVVFRKTSATVWRSQA